MTIDRARQIANLYNNHKWRGFTAELREALNLLVEEGNGKDGQFAGFLLTQLD